MRDLKQRDISVFSKSSTHYFLDSKLQLSVQTFFLLCGGGGGGINTKTISIVKKWSQQHCIYIHISSTVLLASTTQAVITEDLLELKPNSSRPWDYVMIFVSAATIFYTFKCCVPQLESSLTHDWKQGKLHNVFVLKRNKINTSLSYSVCTCICIFSWCQVNGQRKYQHCLWCLKTTIMLLYSQFHS